MLFLFLVLFFFFSSRRRHTRCSRDWSSDVCSSDLIDLNNSEGFVQPKPSGRICKGTPVQPPFSLRCTELTRTFNCTPAKETGYKRLIHHRHFSCVVDFSFSE